MKGKLILAISLLVMVILTAAAVAIEFPKEDTRPHMNVTRICVGDTINFDHFVAGHFQKFLNVTVENQGWVNETRDGQKYPPCSPAGYDGGPWCDRNTFNVNLTRGDRCELPPFGSVTVVAFLDNDTVLLRNNFIVGYRGACPSGTMFKLTRQELNEIIDNPAREGSVGVSKSDSIKPCTNHCMCYDLKT